MLKDSDDEEAKHKTSHIDEDLEAEDHDSDSDVDQKRIKLAKSILANYTKDNEGLKLDTKEQTNQ